MGEEYRQELPNKGRVGECSYRLGGTDGERTSSCRDTGILWQERNPIGYHCCLYIQQYKSCHPCSKRRPMRHKQPTQWRLWSILSSSQDVPQSHCSYGTSVEEKEHLVYATKEFWENHCLYREQDSNWWTRIGRCLQDAYSTETPTTFLSFSRYHSLPFLFPMNQLYSRTHNSKLENPTIHPFIY